MKTLFLLSLLLFLPLALSLSISCEVGGPYTRPPRITVAGNVTQDGVGTAANITLKIYKGDALRIVTQGESDADGKYYFILDGSGLEIGEYSVNLTADNGTHLANCSDTFSIQVAPSPTCEDTLLLIKGKSLYAEGGVVSGRVSVGVEGTKYHNSTSFTNGQFSVYLRACLYRGKRYIVNVIVTDSANRQGTSQIIFSIS